MSKSTSRRAASKLAPPALERVRLAERSDASRALALCTDAMKKTFRISRVEDIEYLIENSVLAITQMNVNNEVVGFLSLREYPQVPAVDPLAWEEYMWARYKTIELKARNTIWIHLMCWSKLYAREVVDAMLKSVYIHDPYLQYICMVKTIMSCPQLIPGSSRAEATFRRVQAMERGIPGDQLPVLLIADRTEVCPKLRVRRAVEEDNDDIVPIVDRHSDRLRELYGDFYVSELISRHPESERVLLVCEHKELAVGVMCLNTQINFESLEECFELSPYAGLRKLNQPPRKHRSMDIESFVSEANVGAGDSVCNLENILSTCFSTDTMRGNKPESISPPDANVLYDAEDGKGIGGASMLEYLDLFTEDEDLEFDIINIDPEYLRVPYLASGDNVSRSVTDTKAKDDIDILYDEPLKKESKKKSTSVSRVPEYIIRYSGPSNAFLLEMCAMHQDYDERRAYDMLEAAYELFPDRDYCVMSLPSSHPPFPILEHFTLVTPHSTRMRFINESLYVAHVNSIRGDVAVRPGELVDTAGLIPLLEYTPKRDTMISLFEEALKSRTLDTFMLLSQRQPIGVVIVGPLEDEVSIRTQYVLNPEPLWPLSDGVIISGTMSPALEPHARWFLRDIMRQSHYSSLFWICTPFAKGDQCPKRNMMSLTERMIPVKPRISLPNISGLKNIDLLFKDLSNPIALWMIERPSSSFPKVNVNNSIVVVGASRTGLAFIEALVLGPVSKYLTFTNLTLVSEHGLPTVVECLKVADTAIPNEGRYTDHYLKSVPFCFYVDVMPALLVEIDRKKKCIYLSTGGLKYYDELVLTCGQQFQHPDYLKDFLEKVKDVRKGMPCERILMDNPKYRPERVPPAPIMPTNLFLINSLLQANVVFRKLLGMMSERRDEISKNNRIVVYGDCLEAYCCISALLELGLAGKEIAFVENYPPEDFTACRINCFNDEVIDEHVQEKLKALGVRCYRNTRITKLHIHNKKVIMLSLMDPLHAIQIQCFALFYYGLKAININAFKAINECGLVYDGGLVVGGSFDTNDPHIFGAGTCCNYSRCLYSADRNHKYYNSEEVGESLADFFMHRFDPFIRCHPQYSSMDLLPKYSSILHRRSHTSIPDVNPSRLYLTQQPAGRGWQPVMKFESPIVKACILPGPLYYLKARKPGPDIPMEVQLNLPHQGHILTTDKNENYFRLRLNLLHCVDAVTCLSKEAFSVPVFSQLYGKHEAFFNKLLLRYQMELIDDLYSFFVQPWMSAMYQGTFDELMDNINNQEIGPGVLEAMKSKCAMLRSDDETPKTPKISQQIPETSSAMANPQQAESQTEKTAKVSRALRASRVSRGASTCFDVPECQVVEEPMLPRSIGFVISNYAARTNAQIERTRGPSDIPSECGQSAAMRDEVGAFWDALGGERLVNEQVARHLEKFAVPNPQYAQSDPKYY